VPLYNSKSLISRSCPILVLTTIIGRPRHADYKNDNKTYQGPTTSGEYAIRKYHSPHMFFLHFPLDCSAALQSIPVPNPHSGADYLVLHFWGPWCLQAGPIQI
jgi:hypothetical protein